MAYRYEDFLIVNHCDQIAAIHSQNNIKAPLTRMGPSSYMARPERFELPASASGGQRSIQLSYGRKNCQNV